MEFLMLENAIVIMENIMAPYGRDNGSPKETPKVFAKGLP
jgi:hypothetical protein